MWCKYCGIQLDDDAKFCPNCGKPIQRLTQPTPEPPKPEPPKPEPPKPEPPKEEPPKEEPPKQEPPKWEPPKQEPPKWEAPGRKSSGGADWRDRVKQKVGEYRQQTSEPGTIGVFAALRVLLLVYVVPIFNPLFLAFLLWMLCVLLSTALADAHGFLRGLSVLLSLGVSALAVWKLLRMDQTRLPEAGNPNLSDRKNMAYLLWDGLLEGETPAPVEMKGLLDPRRIKRKHYPTEPMQNGFAMTTMNQYYIRPGFWNSFRLIPLYTGRGFTWQVLPMYALQWFVCDFFLNVAATLVGLTIIVSLYYCYVYYPWLIHMARTPHFLPQGMTAEQAKQQILDALTAANAPLVTEQDRILVLGRYPLQVDGTSFHIDLPEDAVEEHKNRYLDELAELNRLAAEALFPERMDEPVMPITQESTRYSGLRIIQGIATTLFMAVIVPCALLYFVLMSSPARQLQQCTLDSYSETVTVGDAFEENFENPRWEDSTHDGEPYVTFTGRIEEEDLDMSVKILFRVAEDEDGFYLKSGTINDTRLSDLELDALVQYGYDGDLETMVTTVMAGDILDAIFDSVW